MLHRVRRGEHIAGLADKYGLPFSAIWDHADNARLRGLRGNPNVLRPGDRVFIPEPRKRVVSGATNQVHAFCKKRDRLFLRVDVTDLLGRDVAGVTCQVDIRSEIREVVVSSKGIVETLIPPNLKKARLVIEGFSYPVLIGEIDPVDQPSGQRERLRNLGYYRAPRDDDESALADALYVFQLECDLEPTGDADQATRDMLLLLHGS